MKIYEIGDNVTEGLQFRANENQFALVHRIKGSPDVYKTTIMNFKEVMNLYQAIQDAVLKPKGG